MGEKVPDAAFDVGEGLVAPRETPDYVLTQVDYMIRCWRCRKLVMEQAGRPWAFTCPRCKARNLPPS